MRLAGIRAVLLSLYSFARHTEQFFRPFSPERLLLPGFCVLVCLNSRHILHIFN